MRHILLGSVRAHGRRYLASALAICLGVSFVAATLVVLMSSRAAVSDAIGPQYEGASHVVTGARPGDESADGQQATVERIERVPGVQAVDVVAITSVRLSSPGGGTEQPMVMSIPADAQLRWQQIESGRLPRAEDEIALDARLLDKYGVQVGDRVEITGPAATTASDATIVGTTATPDVQRPGGPEVFATTAAMAAWAGAVYPDEILVRASGDVDMTALRSAVESAMPGAELMTAEQRTDEVVTGLTRNFDVQGAFLLGFAAIAVFVAILVVTNTFTVLLTQRVRELALLRCVGARRRQLFGSLLAEAGVLGLVASGIGLALGYLGGAAAIAALSGTGIGVSGATARLDAVTVLVPLAVGVVATTVAAFLPTRRATMVAPLSALRPQAAIRVRSRGSVPRFVIAAMLVAGGGALMWTGAGGGDGAEILVAVLGGALSFLGVILLGPILVPAVLRLQGLVTGLSRSRNTTGSLAVANALRNPRRTAATASALTVGVTLIVMMAVGAASVRETLVADLDEQYPVDVTVFGMDDDGVTDAEAGAVQSAVGDTDGVATTASMSTLDQSTVTIGESEVRTLGADPDALARVLRDDTLAGEFESGTALIGPGLADALGVSDHDEIVVDGPAGSVSVDLRVLAAMVSGSELVLTNTDLAELGRPVPDRVLWAQLDDDADVRAVVDEIEETVAGMDNAQVGGGAPARGFYDQILQIMLLIAVGLLAIAVLIALVGVGNTLSLSIIERTREHALLRALGLRRGQLRGVVATEAALLAGAAVIIGVPLGVFYGWAGTATLLGQLTEHTTLAVPVVQLLLVVTVAFGAGLLASVLPARRAATVAPAGALADAG